MKNLFILFFLLFFNTLFAQISITTGSPISIDFNSFTGIGFAPTPAAGRLDSDEWVVTGMSDGDGAFGGTFTTGDFARGSSIGAVGTGGVYAFEVSAGDFGLGVQPGGSDFTPGSLILMLINNTGALLTEINLQYDIYVYNDQARANSFNFSYSVDSVTYTPIGALDYTSTDVADGSPSWISIPRLATISTLSIANGDTLYLSWSSNDVSGGGSRDQFALDNIIISDSDTPLPVELTSFRANAGDQKVTLKWNTASEVNNQGFEIYRGSVQDGDYDLIDSYSTNNNLRGAGTSSTAHNYSYIDYSVFNNQQYWYKLVDISVNGERKVHGPIKATPNASPKNDRLDLPTQFELHENYPNPFNPKTTISFDVPVENVEGIFITLNIYNMLGQKVETLYRKMTMPGNHSIAWNGTDINGKALPSGVYIYRIESDQFVQSKKMLLLE